MNVKALAIYIGARRAGLLFQYPLAVDQVINRFVADEAFLIDPHQEVISLSYWNPGAQAAYWRNRKEPRLNGSYSRNEKNGMLLPSFFQNLLPEGPLRELIAEKRGCTTADHFELLAATGKDLPGNVSARPVDLTREELGDLITDSNDALEMSITAEPMEEGVSVSGVQAKLAAVKVNGRFVARTKLTSEDTGKVRHVIAKLPVVKDPFLPELEDLSLRMAHAAGVNTVEAELAPLGLLEAEHGYDLGDVNAETKFLAVFRYDRDTDTPNGRIHAEDFAQILGVQPEEKYKGGDYLSIARILQALPSLGEPAVHELLRRILVSEMLGNPDMHLKNIGLIYPDGRTPVLPPAYDIVGYAAYRGTPRGRALHLNKDEPEEVSAMPRLRPAKVRDFCRHVGIIEKPVFTALRRCAEKAYDLWPGMIKESRISETMKTMLLQRLHEHQAQAKQ